MERRMHPRQVVFTNRAQCRDCYRCLRACPVKAIRMHDNQAFVVADRCIACGTCIRECPQGAKTYRNDVEHAVRLMKAGGWLAASLAPAFAAAWPDWERRRVASALRSLGFSYVAETAVGAYFVARKTVEDASAHGGRPNICTACPAVVQYVEQYVPDMVDTLVPCVSPMIAHARHIKAKRPDAKVVFIGPCVAKKSEMERLDSDGAVDCVLTFAELDEWFKREGIDPAKLEESGFDEEPAGASRFFPVPGGLARTGAMSTDLLDLDVAAVSGVEEITHILQSVREHPRGLLIEPLFCLQGCVTGPGMPHEANAYTGRAEVLEYARRRRPSPSAEIVDAPAPGARLSAAFAARPIEEAPLSDAEIATELERTGKARPEDHLNCGACGYPTCRDKAVANLRGMAEPEMCVPYMRRLAEQRSDRIIETSPNGIVILDEHLNILNMNPAFQRMFMCSGAVLGKRISYLMDPAPFEKLASGEAKRVETTNRHDSYSLVCHELMYALEEEKQYVGIFVNVTKSHDDEEKLRRLRSDTVMQAQELLEHQLAMAQQMARFLGESTAQGEALVRNLMRVAGAREE